MCGLGLRHDNVMVSQHAQYQDETKAAKWKTAIIKFIIYTCAFLLWHVRMSSVSSVHFTQDEVLWGLLASSCWRSSLQTVLSTYPFESCFSLIRDIFFLSFCSPFFFLFSCLPFHHCALLPLCSLVKGKCLGTATGRFIIYFLDQPCMLVARSDGTPETMASEEQPHNFYSCFIHFDYTKSAWNIQSQADDVIRWHGNRAAFRKKGK